jgi:Tat protein secretion system quality control protein TatD with DNase activity
MWADAVNKEHILVESDGPFLTKQPLKMIQYVYDALSSIWETDKHITEEIISVNFEKCRTIATEK